jgi:acyl transferase domain-containing protein
MTANEANGTDGQQRLMLEVAYEALENAGVPMHTIVGSKTGVYVGCFTKDFESLGGRDPFGGPFYVGESCVVVLRSSWTKFHHRHSLLIESLCCPLGMPVAQSW